jgi:uncharacterized protein YjbI with pentapeptide repeats
MQAADLSEAMLDGADLRGADFTGARLAKDQPARLRPQPGPGPGLGAGLGQRHSEGEAGFDRSDRTVSAPPWALAISEAM